jgi:hypothetical protein
VKWMLGDWTFVGSVVLGVGVGVGYRWISGMTMPSVHLQQLFD